MGGDKREWKEGLSMQLTQFRAGLAEEDRERMERELAKRQQSCACAVS